MSSSLSPPRVSVLMPVYNAAPFVEQAVRSILQQTFTDLELIVVDDGSTDGSAQIVAAIADPRLRLVRQPTNAGIVAALNTALEHARGEYLARMDADDISEPQRIERQVAFLDQHPDVLVLGSAYRRMEDDRVVHMPLTHEEIRLALLTHNPIAHPTVMMRARLPQGGPLRYPADTAPAEDQALWSTLVQVGRMANLPEPLIRYRTHPGQSTKRLHRAQLARRAQVRTAYWNACFGSVLSDPAVFTGFLLPGDAPLARSLAQALAAFDAAKRANPGTARFPTDALAAVLSGQRAKALRSFSLAPGAATLSAWWGIRRYWSELQRVVGLAGWLRFTLKCWWPFRSRALVA